MAINMTRKAFLSSLGAACAPALTGQARRRNLVFILTDDQRYNFIGALGHPWLRGHTPHMDRLLRDGVNFRNAFVTTSLCSPSRASMLTGLYMHAHGVLDNFTPLSPSLATFPGILRQNGYRTAFIGKWHMGGESDEARPGFDNWISFHGQGEYFNPRINRNGDRRQADGYLTDILTEEANRFIRDNAQRPFCLYLSHKAVHYPFQAHPRHESLFQGLDVPKPATFEYREDYYAQLPEWVRRRRYTRHGVDGRFGQEMSYDESYRGYCRGLVGVDESLGAVISQLEQSGLLEDTLLVYMGDNGYLWGEHGMVDKRTMHEASLRVPMIAHCPSLLPAGRTVEGMALNLDIAPTFLDAAGMKPPASMQGRSLLPLALGKAGEWRKDFIYEYEWDQDFPYTPTITGLRTERYSLMQYQGVFDISELYDLEKDPEQRRNLLAGIRLGLQRGRYSMNIPDAELRALVERLQARLAVLLKETGGDPRRSGQPPEGVRSAL